MAEKWKKSHYVEKKSIFGILFSHSHIYIKQLIPQAFYTGMYGVYISTEVILLNDLQVVLLVIKYGQKAKIAQIEGTLWACGPSGTD